MLIIHMYYGCVFCVEMDDNFTIGDNVELMCKSQGGGGLQK